jgi:hypothetical protein
MQHITCSITTNDKEAEMARRKILTHKGLGVTYKKNKHLLVISSPGEIGGGR